MIVLRMCLDSVYRQTRYTRRYMYAHDSLRYKTQRQWSKAVGQKPLPLSLKRWDAVVRPVALHLFAACWDGMPAFPVIEETARALLWVEAHTWRRPHPSRATPPS